MAINAGKAEVTLFAKFKDELTNKSQKAFAKFKKTAQTAMKAAVIAIAAFGVAMAKSISLANKQELAIAKLEGALRATGKFTRELSRDMQAMASAFQQVSTTGDETVLELQALLFAMGATETNIKRVLQATLDLSAGMGVDARAAALLFGKALSGDFGTLSRYGILVGDVEGKSAKLAAALTQVQQKFGGQAQAQAETFGGQMKQVGNAFGDMLEEIGFVITKSEIFLGLAGQMKSALEGWTTSIKNNRKFLQALARDIVGGVQIAFNVLSGTFKTLSTNFSFVSSKVQSLRARWSDLIAAFKTNQVEEMEAAMRNLANAGRMGSEQFKTLGDSVKSLRKNIKGNNEETKRLVDSANSWMAIAIQGAMATVSFSGNLKEVESSAKGAGEALEVLNAAAGSGIIDPFATQDFKDLIEDKRFEDMEKASKTATDLQKKINDLDGRNVTEVMSRIGQSTEDAFVQISTGAVGLWEGMKNVALSTIEDISRAMIRSSIIQPLFGGGGGGGGIITDAIKGFDFSSIFGGFFADGGGVQGGVPIVVGERGPELFTPGQSGQVTSNKDLKAGGGGSPVSINQYFQLGVPASVRAEMQSLKPVWIEEAKAAIAEERSRNSGFSEQMGV